MVDNKKKEEVHRAWRSISCPLFVLSFLAFSLSAAPARASLGSASNQFPKTRFRSTAPVSAKKPVLLTADAMDYDQKNDVAVATGHVSLTQGDTVVLADTLIYDRGRNIVQAMGHVSMLEPSGNVYFADSMVLSNDLKSGAIEQVRARLVDNSLFVANRARKIDDQHISLFKVAYTPCKCFTDSGKPKEPLWSLKARDAMIDEQNQEVDYHGVSLNALGIPVIYTPYFSNPTPGADNQSGLLMPQFMHSTILGAVYKQPVYYSIAPDKDVTFIPIYTSRAGPVAAGEYRQMFDSGKMSFDGSITSAPNQDGQGNPIPGHEWRGNVDARGDFKAGTDSDWGFDVHRATDDTYLRAYGFSNDIFLTSRLYGETFNFADSTRSYASAEGLSFQGLTGQDNGKVIPVVAPLINGTWESNPGLWNSRFQLSGNAMVLTRQIGDDSRRLSGTAGWTLPYISSDGQVITFNTSLRTDVYDVSNVQIAGNPNFTGVTGREVPQASLMWRYPFIGYIGTSSITVEPVVSLAAVGGSNQAKIPNEDSLLPEFNDINLFSPNRYAGLDRVENGTGVSYGLRGQAQLYSDKYIDWLLGQHYRLSGDTNFPFSNELGSRFSDYVGKVGLNYQPVTLAYRFRFDRQTLKSNRSEVDASFNEYPVQLSTSYLSLRDDPVLATKEIITGASSLNLTPNWAWNVNTSRDMLLSQWITLATGVTFKNECLAVTTMVGKDYTTLLDIKPSLTFWVTVSLKNLD